MNRLQSKFGDNLKVMGFLCNQFGHQTNESNEEVWNMLKYVRPGAGFEPKFEIFEKVDVNGINAHPLFSWMRKQIPIPMDPEEDTKGNGVIDNHVIALPREGFQNTTVALWTPITRNDVAWNFEKFIIDKQGKVVRRYSRYYPTDLIEKDIEELLSESFN